MCKTLQSVVLRSKRRRTDGSPAGSQSCRRPGPQSGPDPAQNQSLSALGAFQFCISSEPPPSWLTSSPDP